MKHMIRKAGEKTYSFAGGHVKIWEGLFSFWVICALIQSHSSLPFPSPPPIPPTPLLCFRKEKVRVFFFLRQLSLLFVLDLRLKSGNGPWRGQSGGGAVSYISEDKEEKLLYPKWKSLSGDKHPPMPPPAANCPPHCCGNVQQGLSCLWDPAGVIQGARRKTLMYSAPGVNSQGLHWPPCGLSGLMECALAASKCLNSCDLGHQEKTWCVPCIKQDPKETNLETPIYRGMVQQPQFIPPPFPWGMSLFISR